MIIIKKRPTNKKLALVADLSTEFQLSNWNAAFNPIEWKVRHVKGGDTYGGTFPASDIIADESGYTKVYLKTGVYAYPVGRKVIVSSGPYVGTWTVINSGRDTTSTDFFTIDRLYIPGASITPIYKFTDPTKAAKYIQAEFFLREYGTTPTPPGSTPTEDYINETIIGVKRLKTLDEEGELTFDFSSFFRRYLKLMEPDKADFFNPDIKLLPNQFQANVTEIKSTPDPGLPGIKNGYWGIRFKEYYEDYVNGQYVDVLNDTVYTSVNDFIYAVGAVNQFQYPYKGDMYEYVPLLVSKYKFLTDALKFAVFKGIPFTFRSIITASLNNLASGSGGSPVISTVYTSNLDSVKATIDFTWEFDEEPSGYQLLGGLPLSGFNFEQITPTKYRFYGEVGLTTWTGVSGVLPRFTFPSGRRVSFSIQLSKIASQNIIGAVYRYLVISSGLSFRVALRVRDYNSKKQLLKTSYYPLAFPDIIEGVYSLGEGTPINEIPTSNTGDIKFKDYCLFSTTGTGIEISEVKEAYYFGDCHRYPITLTWLNLKGGWDQFTFAGKRAFSNEVSDKVMYKKDINQGNYFTEGGFENGIVSQKVERKINVYSQSIPEDLFEWVGKVNESAKVFIMDTDNERLVGVTVSTDSIEYLKDGKRLYDLNLELTIANEVRTQTA